jgi:hypothetical protein
MVQYICEKLRRLKKGFNAGGFEYLLSSFASRFPEWLFKYYHTYLIEADHLHATNREHKGYSIRFATPEDAGNLESVGVDREKALHRFGRADKCAIVLKGDSVVACAWSTVGRIYVGMSGSIVDTGPDGVYLYGLYSVPEERLKGFHVSCLQKQGSYYESQGRRRKYGVIEALNTNSIVSHLRAGFRITGETYYLAIAGISFCYYRKWPQKTRKVHVFFRRPPQKLEWV